MTRAYEQIQQESRDEGRREGRREGVLEGQRRVILRQIEIQSGELRDAVVARIEAANASELARWAESVLLGDEGLEEEEVFASARAAYEELTRESRQEGRAEGWREGVLEGERRVLLGQLQWRFGVLPKLVVARIQSADESELEIWAGRVLDVNAPDEVLAW